ncbi:MAG TPA: hypothetical protein VII59_13695, partial [Streptosporangiaceae bacterium]
MRDAGWEAERVGPGPSLSVSLSLSLGLELAGDGAPVNPLVVLDLDRWRGASDEEISRAAGLVAAALPVTVGVL